MPYGYFIWLLMQFGFFQPVYVAPPPPVYWQAQMPIPTYSVGGAYQLIPFNPGNQTPPPQEVVMPPCRVIQPGLSVCS